MSKAATARRAKMLTKATPERDAWLCGYAAALAAVNRLFDRPSIVKDVMVADGLDPVKLAHGGAEAFDMREIRKAWK